MSVFHKGRGGVSPSRGGESHTPVPKMHFEYGPMNAGKTAALRRRHAAYERDGRSDVSTLVCDPFVVGQGGEGLVPLYDTTDLGGNTHHMGYAVGPATALLTFLSHDVFVRTRILLVDNAHFLTEKQVHNLLFLSSGGSFEIHCYGLRTDFQGAPFAGAALLMCCSDTLVAHTGRCHCGEPSTATIRIDMGGRVVLSGQSVHTCRDAYRSVCPAHWREATAHRRAGPPPTPQRAPLPPLPHPSRHASVGYANRRSNQTSDAPCRPSAHPP